MVLKVLTESFDVINISLFYRYGGNLSVAGGVSAADSITAGTTCQRIFFLFGVQIYCVLRYQHTKKQVLRVS